MAIDNGKPGDGGLEALFEDQDFQIVEDSPAATPPGGTPAGGTPAADAAALALREERALVALEIAFATAKEAVQGYSETVGVGQLAVLTNQTLRKGSELTLRILVPGWSAPMTTVAKVTWSRPDALGIALTELSPEQKELWRKLVIENTTMVERMKRQFSRQTEHPVPAKVTTRRTVLVQLADEMLADVILELLNQSGYVAGADPATGSRPNILVAELATVPAVTNIFKALPLVLVNAAGPNDLARARLPHLRPRAFVAKPVSAARVLQAINQVFQGR